MAGGGVAGAALCPLSPRPVPAAPQVCPAAMADGEGDPGVFSATALPGDPRLLPTVTSAFLGTRVFRDILHAAGVFSGAAGDTHRADVPSPLGLRMAAPGTHSPPQSFTLNTWTGEQGAAPSPGALLCFCCPLCSGTSSFSSFSPRLEALFLWNKRKIPLLCGDKRFSGCGSIAAGARLGRHSLVTESGKMFDGTDHPSAAWPGSLSAVLSSPQPGLDPGKAIPWPVGTSR